MSINFFNGPASPEAIRMMREMFGEPVAADEKQFLYDRMREIRQPEMKKLANAAKQPVTVEVHGEGDIKTMADGTRYQVTPSGWRKLDRAQ